MGDRIAVMSDGLLQQVGTPAGAVRPPGQQVRRRLHRQPVDELHRGHPGGHGRPGRGRVHLPDPGSLRRESIKGAGTNVVAGFRRSTSSSRRPAARSARSRARRTSSSTSATRSSSTSASASTTSSRSSTRRIASAPATSSTSSCRWRSSTCSTPRRATPIARTPRGLTPGDLRSGHGRSDDLPAGRPFPSRSPDDQRPDREPRRQTARAERVVATPRSCIAGGTWSSASTRSSAWTGRAAPATSLATRGGRRPRGGRRDRLLLVRQWRMAAGRVMLEIPAGDPGRPRRRDGGPGRRRPARARGGDGPPGHVLAQAGRVLDGARVRLRADAPVPRHGDWRASATATIASNRTRTSTSSSAASRWTSARALGSGGITDAKSILGILWLDRLRRGPAARRRQRGGRRWPRRWRGGPWRRRYRRRYPSVRAFRPGDEVAIHSAMLEVHVRGELDGVARFHLDAAADRLRHEPDGCAVAELAGQLAGWVVPDGDDLTVAPALRRACRFPPGGRPRHRRPAEPPLSSDSGCRTGRDRRRSHAPRGAPSLVTLAVAPRRTRPEPAVFPDGIVRALRNRAATRRHLRGPGQRGVPGPPLAVPAHRSPGGARPGLAGLRPRLRAPGVGRFRTRTR